MAGDDRANRGSAIETIKRRLRNDRELANALSGGMAGAITSVVVCPLDVLKTRLQVSGMSAPKLGLVGGLKGIVATEGVGGLYRGLAPTLVALLPNWAVYFTAYERLKRVLATRTSLRADSPALHVASAAGAGAATMLVVNPMWVIKTRLQAQGLGIAFGPRADGNGARGAPAARAGGARAAPLTRARPRAAAPRYPIDLGNLEVAGPTHYRGLVDAARRIVSTEGVRGLYAGLAPSLAGVSHVAIQFPLYEAAKSRLARQHPDDPSLAWWELVVAAAASKLVASTVTYPHEVVRAHMHVTGAGTIRGLLDVCNEISARDGYRGFYNGCGINLLRTVPAAAVTFVAFEYIHRAITSWSWEAEQLDPRDEDA